MQQILEFIRNNKLGKHRVTNDEIEIGCLFDACPNNGEPQFYINTHSEAWKCHRCHEAGHNLRQLGFKLGLIVFKDPTKESYIFIPETEIEQYRKDLAANPKALAYLKTKRCLSDGSIYQFKLGFKIVNGNPAIVIPYFDRKKACVGMKYDFFERPAGSPKYTKEKGSKTILFNLNNLDFNQEVILTEGEYDAISLWQYGYLNVGSMPNGAADTSGWIEDVQIVKEFYLCLDNDSAGAEAADRLGQAWGLSKCKRVYPRLKDMNDYLQCGLEVKHVDEIFNHAEPMFNAPVSKITQYQESAIEMLKNPEKFKGIPTGWKSIDSYLGGIRFGEVTVSSGMTGHGKTTFAISLIGNLLEKETNCLIISPEMREPSILLDLASNHYREIANESQVKEFVNDFGSRIYIAKVFDSWTDKQGKSLLDQTFDIIEYSIRNYNVKFVLLDHLRLFINPKEQDNERFAIDEFMKKSVHLAIKNQIHLWVVVQPKNLMANQKKVTIHDLKGSSNISQDCHNVVLIHRNTDVKKAEDLVEVQIAKNRELGSTGVVTLQFDLNSKNNYYETE